MNGVSQSIKSITDRLVRLGVKFHETSMIAQSIHVLYVKWNGTDAWKYSSVAASFQCCHSPLPLVRCGVHQEPLCNDDLLSRGRHAWKRRLLDKRKCT